MAKTQKAKEALPSNRSNWRDSGVFRATIEFPMELWNRIKGASNKKGLKPSHIIRLWMQERLDEEEAKRAA